MQAVIVSVSGHYSPIKVMGQCCGVWDNIGYWTHKSKAHFVNIGTYIKDDLGPEEDVQETSKCEPHQ